MIKVLISADSRYDVDRNFVRAIVEDVLVGHRIKSKAEVEILIVGDRRMHELNHKFRHLDETTDVLAFPLEDPSFTPQGNYKGFINSPDKILRLGDVVISYPQAALSAAEQGVSVEEELKILIEHGVSHLLGIHHQ